MSGNGTRRPRVRPPGAKNKPKPLMKKGGDAGIRQVTLQFTDGSNILEGISSYAAWRRVGVIPVGITGAVSNVVLRSFNSTNLPGCHNVIYLRGTLMIPPGGRGEKFTVMLEGPEGKATRGTMVGPLVAAGEVILSALYFTSVEYCKLLPTPAPTAEGVKWEEEEEEGAVVAPIDPLQRLIDLAMSAFASTSYVPPHTHF